MTIVTQQAMQLNQRLSDMADIFNFVLARAALDHVDRFPMPGQWVLLYVRTYILETQNASQGLELWSSKGSSSPRRGREQRNGKHSVIRAYTTTGG